MPMRCDAAIVGPSYTAEPGPTRPLRPRPAPRPGYSALQHPCPAHAMPYPPCGPTRKSLFVFPSSLHSTWPQQRGGTGRGRREARLATSRSRAVLIWLDRPDSNQVARPREGRDSWRERQRGENSLVS